MRIGIRGRKWESYRVPITAEVGDYRLWGVILVLFDLPL
jgi:sensor domain CHASE-containing protein